VWNVQNAIQFKTDGVRILLTNALRTFVKNSKIEINYKFYTKKVTFQQISIC